MEKILAKKGIRFLSYIDEEKDKISFAFTPAMLEQQVFILLTQCEIGDEDEPLCEVTLSVHLLRKDGAYDFTIAVDDRPIVPPLYLYRLILDTVDMMGDCKGIAFFADLTSVSTGTNSSKVKRGRERDMIYQYNENYWNTLLELINASNIQNN